MEIDFNSAANYFIPAAMMNNSPSSSRHFSFSCDSGLLWAGLIFSQAIHLGPRGGDWLGRETGCHRAASNSHSIPPTLHSAAAAAAATTIDQLRNPVLFTPVTPIVHGNHFDKRTNRKNRTLIRWKF